MTSSNRRTVQFSILAAFATVAFGGLSVSGAQVPAVQVKAEPASLNPSVSSEQRLFNQRLLLRYTQLWNMYRFRNEGAMTRAQREKVNALIAEVQAPKLHADMPAKDIRSKIAATATELTKLLKAEAAGNLTPDHATANLAYLHGTLLKGMDNPKTYAMDAKKFRDEFLAVHPADPSLPDSITQRASSGDVKPAPSAGNTVN